MRVRSEIKYMHCNVHCSTVDNSQDTETTEMSTDRGMQKEDPFVYTHTHTHTHTHTMEYYSAIKKNETMPLASTWMDLEIVILNEVSQGEKDKYHMIPFTCGT